MTHRYDLSGIVLRLYLCARTIIVAVVSLGEPESLNGRLIASSGALAYVLTSMLVACAVVGIVDLIINDLAPERFTLPWAREHRHLGYIGLSCGSCAFLFVMAKHGNLSYLSLSYAADGLAAACGAVTHVFHHQRSRRWPFVERRRRPPL